MFQTNIPTFKVSELTRLIKGKLEESFPVIRLTGEISNFRPASSGHCYFILKDRDAMINAVLFRREFSQLDFKPRDGQLVQALGRVSLYPQRGSYQIICESIEALGTGEILKMLEERKRNLALEGLFDSEAKIPIPPYPQHIGIITSATGAAIQDIKQVLSRRMHSFKLSIWNTAVQGEEAAKGIVKGLEYFNSKMPELDVILLSRGGGSLEDLLPFSEESVVRAVAASTIPILSAVGHEIDFPLCDFAADLRAPTPSAGAEILSNQWLNLAEKATHLGQNLNRSFRMMIQDRYFDLERIKSQGIDDSFYRILQNHSVKLRELNQSQHYNFSKSMKDHKHKLALLSQQLESLSPDALLNQGYALIEKEDRIERSISGLNDGDIIRIHMRDGSTRATINKDSKNENI